MVTLGLLALFAVIVVISALVGLARGMNKAVIRIITLALAVVLTFLIAGSVTAKVDSLIQIDGQTLGQMVVENLRDSEMIAMMLDTAPLMQEAILVAPAFVMSIVIFPVVFMLLSFLSWILFLIVQKPLRKAIFKDSCNKEEAAMQPTGVRVGKRFAGMGIGIVTGMIIFGMIMTPIFGVFSILPSSDTMDDVLDTMVEQNILSASDAEFILNTYGVTDSALVKMYGMVGLTSAGRAYLSSVSKIEANGYETSLVNEFGSLLETVQGAAQSGLLNVLMATDDPNAIYNFLENKDAVDALMQNLFQSELLRAAVPEVMAMAVESAASGMNVPANKEAVYNNMMDSIAQAVKNTDVDFAAIKAYEDAHGSVFSLARTGDKATDGIMTEEEYEAEIQKLVDLAKTISSILNRSLSGDNAVFTDSVADHIVNEVKVQATENGNNSLDSFDATSVQAAISNIDAADVDAGEADAGKLLDQLADQEKFETDVATVETITQAIRETVKNAMADDTTAAQTATTLATVVSDVVGAVSAATDENGNLDASKLDFEKIASAVTTLQNSPLKDLGSSVLDMVVSGDLGANSMVSDMISAVKDGYEKGEDIGGTIGTAGALIGLGSAMGNNGENSQEAMVNSLTDLINNLNDYTISLLPTILSKDTITGMGVPAEYADATFNVIETLLKELMKLKGAEDYTNEVNSILSLYNLATTGLEQFKEEDVADLVNYAIESDAIFNTLVSISTSNPFGIQIEDETTRANIANAIEDNYEKSGKTQRELDIYTAVATLLGLEDEVKLG